MPFSNEREDGPEYLNALSSGREDKGRLWSGSPLSSREDEYQRGREKDGPEYPNALSSGREDKGRFWSGSPFSSRKDRYHGCSEFFKNARLYWARRWETIPKWHFKWKCIVKQKTDTMGNFSPISSWPKIVFSQMCTLLNALFKRARRWVRKIRAGSGQEVPCQADKTNTNANFITARYALTKRARRRWARKIRARSGQEVPCQAEKTNSNVGEKIRADSGQEVPSLAEKTDTMGKFLPTSGGG
ncbi:hypothetical protein CHS0354_005438 [Potamilus streckersoni]|uniref:Uncharacterized protein n=1 Tax=Potamilus streckersoni TaxID=2493646 RepID=A0AAE0TIL2_9BIVA|nr:hypothetical protein CHS0354_005438 [Potamilus streckersoni]